MFENFKDETLNNKWLLLVIILILGIVLFSFMAKVINRTTYKKSTRTGVVAVSGKSSGFVNGYSWDQINKLPIPLREKIMLKLSLLKVSIESSIINGKPVIQPAEPLPTYLSEIDSFYKNAGDMDIPLFFALKAADLKKNGASKQAILNFKLLVKQKLKKLGILNQ